jgi:hypothetical protein
MSKTRRTKSGKRACKKKPGRKRKSSKRK